MDVVERYLVLCLRLGKHIDGFVDFYFGPPRFAEQVAAEELASAHALAAEARELRGSLDALGDPVRERWLGEQLEGLLTVAERLDGVAIPYEEEVRRCFGVALDPATEDELEAAHRRLDQLVPGAGPLGERYRAWRQTREVDPDKVLPAMEALTAELRGRTDALFGLPEGESVEIELVKDKPWGAFNDYLGGRRSRVSVNTDIPLRAEMLPLLAAHEIYPGHHTEHALKEALLVDVAGDLEEAIAPVATPQSLVSEGIASAGETVEVLGSGTEAACVAVLEDFGAGYDLELLHAVQEAEEPIRRLGDAAAHLLHVEGRGLDEVQAFGERWSLRPPEEVAKIIEFVTTDTWRSYIAVYETGRRLVKAWTHDDPARFRRLLTEHVTTRDLLEDRT